MGYYNPYFQYGDEAIVRDAQAAGVNGFIISDLPPEESVNFRHWCQVFGYALPRRVTGRAPSVPHTLARRLSRSHPYAP